MAKKSAKKGNGGKGKQEDKFNGITLLLSAVIIFLSFILVNNKNVLGPVGEVISRVLYLLMGKAAYAVPFIAGFYGVNILNGNHEYNKSKYAIGIGLLTLTAAVFAALVPYGKPDEKFAMQAVSAFSGKEFKVFWDSVPKDLHIMDKNHEFFTGGIIGYYSARFLSSWFNIIGAYIICVIATLISIILLGKEQLLIKAWELISAGVAGLAKGIVHVFGVTFGALGDFFAGLKRRDGVPEEKKAVKKKQDKKEKEEEEKEVSEAAKKMQEKEAAERAAKPEEKERKKREKLNIISEAAQPKKYSAVQSIVKGNYKLPPSSLLNSGDSSLGKVDYTTNAEKLKTTLNNFGVEAEVVNVVDGPVISRFEVELAQGIKVSKVENLAADIALAMGVEGVRVAPVSGKSLLGIEIPKSERKTIYFKDIIENEAFHESESLLTMALGKDLGGKPIIAKLQDMPHLLVAGATGSGKSVCLNTIIMSILYKATPDEVKLLLVDPKRVEMTHYKDMPHLVAPVITDVKHAAYVLRRLCAEMDYRYEVLAGEGAQNIKIYNEMINEYNSQIMSEKEGSKDGSEAQETELKKSLPYIVLVIDELADLMTLAKQSVEGSLQRLAQLARAVGIHIVLATQRPSVDVITGVIKANFPSRIAFQVMSKTDSRTILDMNGADALLGKGDMLYAPAELGKPVRGQAAFLTGQEISKVVHFIKKQRKAEYSEEFDIKDKEVDLDAAAADDGSSSEVFKRACDLAREKGSVSTSFLQRKLGLGYSRAARIIDEMEEKGLISEQDGNKPRQWKGE